MSSNQETSPPIKVAMITGHHDYDVVRFQQMLRSFPDIDFYPQNLNDFVQDTQQEPPHREQYEVLAFYNFQRVTPGDGESDFSHEMKGPLEQLGESEQGILMLHHALTAFPRWQYWLDICGMGDTTRPHHPGPPGRVEKQRFDAVGPDHPVTRELTSWEMVDETYNLPDATEGSEVLLTTEAPGSMRTIAWTRKHRNARVFCYQSGHDDRAYSDPQFRTILGRGVRWLAGRI
jgi:type 1 glutamine amidotransferase